VPVLPPPRRRTDGDAPGGSRAAPSRPGSAAAEDTHVPILPAEYFLVILQHTAAHLETHGPLHGTRFFRTSAVVMVFRTFSVGQRGTETMTGSRPDDAVLGAVHDMWRFVAKTGETSGQILQKHADGVSATFR
jgi:hypothetical protein